MSRSNHIILKYKDCLYYKKLTQQLKMFVRVFCVYTICSTASERDRKMFYFSKLGRLSRSIHIVIKYKDCLYYEKLTQQLKMFVRFFCVYTLCSTASEWQLEKCFTLVS